MNKILILLFFIAIASIIQAPAISAWNPNTHYEIAEYSYHSMPSDIQQNLDLNVMKDASDDPDFKFFDFEYHSYPKSYIKVDYWLNEGEKHYNGRDYQYASYCFGVASHYISDSYCAPHAKGKTGIDAVFYEAWGSILSPQVTVSAGSVYSHGNQENYITGDLNLILLEGKINGENSWDNWIKNRDASYVQKDLNKAASASYNAINRRIIESYFK